jgi:hypothetical protein
MSTTQAVSRPHYTSEAEMCAKLSAHARSVGFNVYPETADFDLLLVAGASTQSFRVGDQIGVQAKLAPSVPVLHQALPRLSAATGPHFYGVLVPSADDRFKCVANRLEISVLEARLIAGRGNALWTGASWHRRHPKSACWLPDAEVPELPAGTRSPRQLTPWKQKAIKLCLLAEKKGYLTLEDFDRAGLSTKIWFDKHWVRFDGHVQVNGRRVARYVLVLENRPPHLLDPDVTRALRGAL